MVTAYKVRMSRAIFFWLCCLSCWSASAVAARDNVGGDIWAEAQISQQAPYVQQTLIYMVMVVSRSALSIVDPEPPVTQGLSLERLDEQPLNYPVNFKGTRYQVTAFRYALTPLTLGEIEIPPTHFTVTYPASQWGYSGYGPQTEGRKVELDTNSLKITSQPPAAAQNPWLPLHTLRLSGKLEKGGVSRVGEPLTLTLTLKATGAGGEQLPGLESRLQEALTHFKVYPERPRTHQEVISDDNLLFLSGKREEIYTLIPQQAGRLEIPPIRLDWWNVDKDQGMSVEWPGETVTVVSAGAPADLDKAREVTQPGEVVLGGGLPLLWQLAINILLFLLGLWVGAGHPGTQQANRFLARVWRVLAPLQHTLREAMQQMKRWLFPEALRRRARGLKQSWEALRHPRQATGGTMTDPTMPNGRWLPGRFKGLSLLRAVERAETPQAIYHILSRFAREGLDGRATYYSLKRLADMYCAAYPRLPGERVTTLFEELDNTLYGGGRAKNDFDIHAWKDEFDELMGLLAYRRPRVKPERTRQRGLPRLNPLGEITG